MRPELDPEVLADLRARDASERDRSRVSPVLCECGHHVRDHHATTGVCMHPTGDDYCRCEQFARAGGPSWSPPVIAERWPCSGCGALVDVTAEAIELHATFNRQLAKRGERPLAKRIPCGDCKRREDEERAARMRPHEQTELAAVNEQRPAGRPDYWREQRRNSR